MTPSSGLTKIRAKTAAPGQSQITKEVKLNAIIETRCDCLSLIHATVKMPEVREKQQ